MRNNTTDANDEFDHPLTDPESLFEHDDMSTEELVKEQDQSHFETRSTVGGFAIVGITNDASETLLTSSSDGEWWRLPHARVEQGEAYCSAARRTVEEQLTVGIEIDRVVHVRRFDAVLEESPAAEHAERTEDSDELAYLEGYTESFDLLLDATLDTHVENPIDVSNADSDVTVEWFSSIPDGAPGGLPGEDLRRFIG